MNCPSCEKNSHKIDKCPLINYTPNQSNLLANYRTQNFQNRMEFRRKLFKKETKPLILKMRLIEISKLLNLKFPEFSQLLEIEPLFENSEISIDEPPEKNNTKAVRWENLKKKHKSSFNEESPINEMPIELEQTEIIINKAVRWEGLKKNNTTPSHEESSVNELASMKFVESTKEIDENVVGTPKKEISSDNKIDHEAKNIKFGFEPKTPIELRNMRTSYARKDFIKEKDRSR